MGGEFHDQVLYTGTRIAVKFNLKRPKQPKKKVPALVFIAICEPF